MMVRLLYVDAEEEQRLHNDFSCISRNTL